MGFMDNVQTFTKGVGAKAKGNYDVVAMTTQVSNIKKEITSIYTQLGAQYYALYREDAADGVKDIVNQIKEKENQILALNKQIEDTKAATAAVQLTESNPQMAIPSRPCSNCGQMLVGGAVFCGNCGTKNELPVAPAAPAKQFCGSCGASMDPGTAFCPACGAKQN